MSLRIRRVVVWRTEVENRPGEMARALERLAQQNLEFVMGHPGGSIVDIAPVVGKKAEALARAAGFEPLAKSMTLVEGHDRPGLCFRATRALGDAGVSMDSVVLQVAGQRCQALFGFTSDADAKKAARVIRTVFHPPKAARRKPKR